MADTMTEAQSEREALERLANENPADAAAQFKAAQFEARLWVQNPDEGDLNKIVLFLDRALAVLPEEKRASVAQFVQQLHGRGAQIGPILQGEKYPRLLALMTSQPMPTAQGAAPATPPPPRPASERGYTPTPGRFSHGSTRARTAIRVIDVGEITNDKIKAWISGGQLEELANAYPLIENFRTRRVVIDKIAEKSTPVAAACMLKVLAHTHDENLIAEIVKKLQAFDSAVLANELIYEPNDPKTKLAVVTAMAAIKADEVVEPLTRALRDVDPHVRAKAVSGLADMFESTPEWIGQLGMMIRRDPDAGVRVATGRALAALGTPDALKAFEDISKEPGFDENLRIALDSIRQKVQGAGMAARKAKIAAEQADASKEKFKISGLFNPQYMMAGGFLFGTVLMLYMMVVFFKGRQQDSGLVLQGKEATERVQQTFKENPGHREFFSWLGKAKSSVMLGGVPPPLPEKAKVPPEWVPSYEELMAGKMPTNPPVKRNAGPRA